MDIHNYHARLKRRVNLIESDPRISEENKKLLMKFRDFCFFKGINEGKIDTYLLYLIKFILMLKKSIYGVNKDDLIKILSELNSYEWSEHSKNTFKIAVRRLFQIAYNHEDNLNFYPINIIKIETKHRSRLIPEELLTKKEKEKIIKSCKTPRDKAFISVLADSGAKIGFL